KDIPATLDLFATDVQWEARIPGSPGCRDRADVAAMLDAAVRDGVDVAIDELIEVGSAVVVGFRRRDRWASAETAWCGLWFDGGRVVRITPSPARAAAVAAATGPAPSRRPSSALLVAASDVSKSCRGRGVLHDVSLQAHAGEAVGVVGENGAGKTTLLRICAGVVRPDAGAVSVAGRVGYCPQEPGLLDRLSADDHVVLFGAAGGLGRRAALDRGRTLLGEFGFPVADQAPARELSGGARQKLNLALALLHDPGVVLLDEPYQGFDHGAYMSFWHHVDRWRDQGKAVVIVTHLLAEAERVDRVVELAVPGPAVSAGGSGQRGPRPGGGGSQRAPQP